VETARLTIDKSQHFRLRGPDFSPRNFRKYTTDMVRATPGAELTFAPDGYYCGCERGVLRPHGGD
jgi:hypothetical protein